MTADLSRKYPRRFHFAVSLALALAGTLGLGLLFGAAWSWPLWLASWLIALNVVTLAYFGYDKAQARKAARRVPEAVLHTQAALGGSPGALAGMLLFRHKTIDGPFRIVFWCIVVLQTLLAIWVVKLLWWS